MDFKKIAKIVCIVAAVCAAICGTRSSARQSRDVAVENQMIMDAADASRFGRAAMRIASLKP